MKRFRPSHAAVLPAVLIAFGVVSCGGSPPEPVSIPADFSSEIDVTNLIQSKLRATQAEPGSAEAHRVLGLALVANDGWALGEQSFRNALAIDAGDPESRYQLARTLAYKGDFEGAVVELRRVIEGSPDFVAAHYDLACILLDQGALEDAAGHFERVKQQQPKLLLGEMGLGLVALEREDANAAVQLLSLANQRHPSDAFIRFQLAQAYRLRGDGARGDLARAQTMLRDLEDAGGRPALRSPGTVQASAFAMNRATQIQRAIDRMASGDHASAIPILRRLVDRDPSDVAASNNLAVAYVESGQFDAAMRAIDVSLKLDPDQYTSRVNRASCLLGMAESKRKQGRVPESKDDLNAALEAIDAALELAPRFAQSHVLRGTILAALRRDVEAIQAYRKGLELGETQEATYVALSKVTMRDEGPEEAAAALREGLEQGGPRLQLRFELCGMLLEAGRGAEARAGQKELQRLAPGHHYTKLADRLLRERGL